MPGNARDFMRFPDRGQENAFSRTLYQFLVETGCTEVLYLGAFDMQKERDRISLMEDCGPVP